MWLDVVGRGVHVSGDLRERALQQFERALWRFRDRLGKVTIRLSDVNGPRGGVDKRCQVMVESPGRGAMIVHEADANLYSLIDRAADRIGHAVRRTLERTRQFARHGLGRRGAKD